MSVSLNFGNYNHYYLNKSRIASMVQADEKKPLTLVYGIDLKIF